MRNRPTIVALLLLLALGTPSFAEESPTARLNSYLAELATAKKLSEIKPYLSNEFWSYTYAPLLETTAAEQADLLAETAKSLKGFSVKGETIEDGRAILSVGPEGGEPSPLVMIKENGVWVIHE